MRPSFSSHDPGMITVSFTPSEARAVMVALLTGVSSFRPPVQSALDTLRRAAPELT